MMKTITAKTLIRDSQYSVSPYALTDVRFREVKTVIKTKAQTHPGHVSNEIQYEMMTEEATSSVARVTDQENQ